MYLFLVIHVWCCLKLLLWLLILEPRSTYPFHAELALCLDHVIIERLALVLHGCGRLGKGSMEQVRPLKFLYQVTHLCKISLD
uniref:Secreted protein n=1 Tax=Zea mays TaxID=4577 RepID=B6SJ83_MAIZE|nr:hypothetical protein [Zea mays]